MAKSIIEQLAHTLGRRDEGPNIQLAERLAKSKNTGAIRELAGLLSHGQTAIRHDAIKVLYEIGERKPELIAEFVPLFLQTLQHKDNRMRWGAMSALSAVSSLDPSRLAKHLTTIVDAMDHGSVITRDHGIYILAHVARLKKYHADCMELLLEQIAKAPVNQVPMYAEKMAGVISPPYIPKIISILNHRKDVLEIPTKAKRIEKLLRQLSSNL
jgi:hypothetical protein